MGRATLCEGGCLALCTFERLSAVHLRAADRRSLTHRPPRAYGIHSRLTRWQSVIRAESAIRSPDSEAEHSAKCHPTMPRPEGSASCCAP
eukprot:4471814-Alexandrium_andersonii.AAC.1